MSPPTRIAVTGASGNLGTALLRHLAEAAPDVQVVGICRRPPRGGDPAYDRVQWAAIDITDRSAADQLAEAFVGVEAAVHLAWAIQPSWDPGLLERTNVAGSRTVFESAITAGVGHLVHASSVGVYSPGPKDRPVDESWSRDGVPGSSYSQHKAAVEHALDGLERRPDAPVVARIRPGLIFQREAGSEVARYFLGRLAPTRLIGRRRLPLLPVPDEAVFQAVHASDVADAVHRILELRSMGAFNVAAPPVMTPERLAEVFHARRIALSGRLVRRAADLTWRAHLQPTDAGWVDLAFHAPVMSTARARDELGWVARVDARAALADLLEGMRDGAGTVSPVLAPRGAA